MFYPTDVWALNNRGLAYMKIGRREEEIRIRLLKRTSDRVTLAAADYKFVARGRPPRR